MASASSISRGASPVRSACCSSPSTAPTSSRWSRRAATRSASYEGYRCWNRSRRSVIIDLKSPAGVETFLDLAATADVVVETFRPGVLDRLGVGYDTLRRSQSRPGAAVVPAVPGGHRNADPPRIRRARPGQQRPDVGSAGLADGPDLPAHADAEHGRDVPGRDRRCSPGSAPGSAPASGSTSRRRCAQGALLFTTQIWQEASDVGSAYHDGDGQDVPARASTSSMIFECADGEWLHVSVLSGLTPTQDGGRGHRLRRCAGSLDGNGHGRRGAGGARPATAGPVPGLGSGRADRSPPGQQPRGRGRDAGRRTCSTIPRRSPTTRVATVVDPDRREHDPDGRPHPPARDTRAASRGPSPGPARTTTKSSSPRRWRERR